jgi:phosphatidylserine synthase
MINSDSLAYSSNFLYFISLFLPVSGFEWEFLGFHALFYGWLGLVDFDFFIGIPWLANVLYWINFFMNRKYRFLRFVLSVLTILFALCTLSLPEFSLGAKEDSRIVIGFGFLFWLLSFVILLVGQVKEYRRLMSEEK